MIDLSKVKTGDELFRIYDKSWSKAQVVQIDETPNEIVITCDVYMDIRRKMRFYANGVCTDGLKYGFLTKKENPLVKPRKLAESTDESILAKNKRVFICHREAGEPCGDYGFFDFSLNRWVIPENKDIHRKVLVPHVIDFWSYVPRALMN